MAQYSRVLNASEEQFSQLVGYPFTPHFIQIDTDLKMHYLDEGNPENPLILLLHGEPAWSYIYRTMIPVLVENGYRVIAPDLIGFGKSDKLVDSDAYTHETHTRWLDAFINRLNLTNIHLYAHDWGGMIALRIIAAQPDLFSAVIVSDAFLFTGDEPIPDSFTGWQTFSQTDADFLPGQIIDWGSYASLPESVKQAYNAPSPDERYKAGIRKFPLLIPLNPADAEAKTNRLLREKLRLFSKPFLTIWGDNGDEMWTGKDIILQQEIAGATGQPHKILHAGHFLQEDVPDELTACILDFFLRRTGDKLIN